MENKIKIYVIVGPTASGKTKLGVMLAKKINAEIVSADSMQIYKDICISTAKPTIEEMDGIKHHLIDFCPLDMTYSVADYVNDANKVINDIKNRNKNTIIVGGTGLYINSLIDGITFDNIDVDYDYRNKLEELSNEELYNRLKVIDPIYADKIHANNKKRVIRALELYSTTGKTMSEQAVLSRINETIYDPVIIGLDFESRENLYSRIHLRIDNMIKSGLLDEAKKYKDLGKTSEQAIGIKEMIPYLENNDTLDNCIDNLKKATRHYAKRQLSWFRKDTRINWFYVDKYNNFTELFEDVCRFLDV